MNRIRRLTSVLSADVVNYSGQIRADENRTLEELRKLRRAVFDPLVSDHRGNIVKRMGDGWLVEFGSVSEAVRCAIDIQSKVPGQSELQLRVGVHLGDVVFDEDDLFGDGINLAVRLQEASDTGAVLISDVVHRSLDERLAELFRRAGDRQFKNAPDPVTVYQWSSPGSAPPRVTPPSHSNSLLIGVLPFDNLSSDPDQEFFADGITEEIITTLSKLPNLLVVARNSTFVYKGRSVDVKQVGLEQGVDLVLEGSVRQSGNRVRITAQLINAKTGMHIWADRYDRDMEDVFEIQDEIALRIATELQVELLDGEMARFRGAGTKNLQAWTAQLHAVEASRSITKDAQAEARRFTQQAIALDPSYSAPFCTLGFVYTVEARHSFAADRTAALTQARDCARRALEIDSYNPEAHAIAGFADAIDGQLGSAIEKFSEALALNPNHADVAARLSLTLAFSGQTHEAIRVARQAITLNPHYPGWYAGVLGLGLRLSGRYQEAIEAFTEYGQKAEGFGHLDLAIVYAEMRNLEAARHEAKQVMLYRPQFSISEWAKTQLFSNIEILERDSNSLRLAGLPE
ncbi:adenylate/guanylate cyclase domain-containing protein [Sulfitobacter sp. SK011]|uniref:adenylate/guanylate cyclase domain-containing protein n=1 Tax=Sulfitobacter sp. SK011 TaxID=1389004 RepID=UPI000E0AC0C1|nr:adenylate/guanylate cyclase domain-containing protein [Sulfitobacter sp. SK011]AXI42598.1 adenylate cyclase [Sulfitobacter sp. SK011]